MIALISGVDASIGQIPQKPLRWKIQTPAQLNKSKSFMPKYLLALVFGDALAEFKTKTAAQKQNMDSPS